MHLAVGSLRKLCEANSSISKQQVESNRLTALTTVYHTQEKPKQGHVIYTSCQLRVNLQVSKR